MARHERRPFCDNIFVFIYFLFYFAAAVSSATNATHLLRLTIFRANFQRRPQRSLFIILFILFLLCFILAYLLRFWQRWNTVGNGAPFILVFSSAVIVVWCDESAPLVFFFHSITSLLLLWGRPYWVASMKSISNCPDDFRSLRLRTARRFRFILFFFIWFPTASSINPRWLGLIEFQRVVLGFTGFYWVLLGFTGFYRVLLGFTGFLLEFTGFIPRFTKFCVVSLGSTGLYCV